MKNYENIIEQFQKQTQADAEAIKGKFDSIERSIQELAQRNDGLIFAGGPAKSKTIVDAAVEQYEKHAEIFAKSGNLRIELDVKAAGDAVTTSSGRTIQSGGVGAPGINQIGLQYAIPMRQALGVTAFEYSRYTGLEGAASVQAGEGADKTAVRPTHTLVTQSSLTLAGYTVMSRQALNDSQELKRAVEVTLNRSIADALDSVLWAGNITPAWAGFDSLADTFTNSTYDVLADMVSATAADMQENGFQPTAVVMHPATWVQVITKRADAGANIETGLYLGGGYLEQTAPTLRGLDVVLSKSIPRGTGLVVDRQHVEVLVVQAPVIEIGTTGSQFTKNLATVLMETRVIPVFRTDGAMVLAVPAGVSV
jgi:HK97 family phage major capsid protein